MLTLETAPAPTAYASKATPTPRPLLVAIGGSSALAPLVPAARVLTSQLHVQPQAVAVLDTLPACFAGVAPCWSDAVDPESRLRETARDGLRDALGGDRPLWPIDIVRGFPPHALTRLARARDARLLLMGIGRHRPADRVLGKETTLEAIRLADRPVLAVAADFSGLPRHGVAAVDFSPASVRAAEEALAMLAPGGTLSLVFVRPLIDEFVRDADQAWDRRHNQPVDELFARLVRGLVMPASVKVETTVLAGRPAEEVLAFAERTGADLIAAGSSGAGFLHRTRVGSVATTLLRSTTVSLLVVPRPPQDDRTRIEALLASTLEATSPGRWPALVSAFGIRNTGRRTRLEIDDPDVGAQIEETGYALLGAVYDHHDERLEIVLGDAAVSVRPLTHTIGGVTSIAIADAPDGRDRALRVTHGHAQTILSLLD